MNDRGMRRKLAALCGVLVVAVVPVVVACDNSDPEADAEPGSSPPYGVLRPRDAVDVVDREDFEIVHELASYEAGGVVGVLADGRLITVVNPRTSAIDFDAYVLFLVDPASGDYDRLPLGEANVVGTFAHWGVVRLRSAG